MYISPGATRPRVYFIHNVGAALSDIREEYSPTVAVLQTQTVTLSFPLSACIQLLKLPYLRRLLYNNVPFKERSSCGTTWSYVSPSSTSGGAMLYVSLRSRRAAIYPIVSDTHVSSSALFPSLFHALSSPSPAGNSLFVPYG